VLIKDPESSSGCDIRLTLSKQQADSLASATLELARRNILRKTPR
jgi:hypothetical protein